MSDVISLVKFMFGCGTLMFIAFVVLLALPQCVLRSVALEILKWMFAGLLVFLVFSPVDVVPDLIPLAGWADDLAYIIGAIMAARSAMSERNERERLKVQERRRRERLAEHEEDRGMAMSRTEGKDEVFHDN